jgi:hypothetical protein
MDSSWLGLMEMALVLGVALGWGFWELYSLRKDRQRRDQAPPRGPDRG